MDLLYHFIGGFLIALIIVWLTRVKPLWMLSDKTVIIAGFSGLAAGVLKEAYDVAGYYRPMLVNMNGQVRCYYPAINSSLEWTTNSIEIDLI